MKDPNKWFYVFHPEVKSVATVHTFIDQDKVKVGFAFCSPKDQFSKTLGRKIASGRTQTSSLYDFTGHSSDTVVDAWGNLNKPEIWKNVKLQNKMGIGLVASLSLIDREEMK